MKTYYIYISIVVLSVLAIAAFHLLRHRRRPHPMDDMDGREFESYCAYFLESEGFLDIHLTPDSHDYGIDIFAEKDGVSYAFQCKRYDHPVGIAAIQQAYAGRDYYDCMVGVVMTNQYFTSPAAKMASKLNIMLWDRDYITSPSS